MSINLPPSSLPRVVIAGGGFAGLKLAQALDSSLFQIILIDHHNYHQFPPLIYQVASSGLEPSSIAFPFRAAFKCKKNFIFRLANVIGVKPEQKQLITSVGEVPYDYLVLACGGTTNYFGNEQIAKHSLPMKTLYESMNLRNVLLQNIEKALVSDKPETREALLTVAIVGGGPSGVEIAGALAEMKRYVLPKDYPDMETDQFKIHLIDASPRLLQAMSEKSSRTAAEGLTSLGVEIHHNMMVTDYDGRVLTLGDGTKMNTRTVIWVSGIIANTVEGIQADSLGRGKRILVDGYNEVQGIPDVFALGDQCLMTDDPSYPQGHPQMAQVAIQQAALLAKNLKARLTGPWLDGYHWPKPCRRRDWQGQVGWLHRLAPLARRPPALHPLGAQQGHRPPQLDMELCDLRPLAPPHPQAQRACRSLPSSPRASRQPRHPCRVGSWHSLLLIRPTLYDTGWPYCKVPPRPI